MPEISDTALVPGMDEVALLSHGLLYIKALEEGSSTQWSFASLQYLKPRDDVKAAQILSRCSSKRSVPEQL